MDLAPFPTPTAAHDQARAVQLRQELVDWAKGKVATWGSAATAASPTSPATPSGLPPESGRALILTRLDRPWPGPRQPQTSAPSQSDEMSPHDPLPPTAAATSARAAVALQIHNRYLVAETDEGVTIIDQHALHERILYEALRERVLGGAVETQNLLVPEPVDLSPVEAAAALEQRDLLAQLGMKVEPFGGGTILIAGYPAMLANLNPVEVLRELLGRLLEGGKQPDRRDLLDDLLHTIACKAAIKAGDRLSPEEIAALLEQRHLIDDAHHCPHGRPTELVLTREELDKRFKRV